MLWTQEEAIYLAAKIETVAPSHGCHVALTGGCLYKSGGRKDCDILFYRIRQVEKINFVSLFHTLLEMGFERIEGFGWCFKATYYGKPVDMLFPEEIGGEYVEGEEGANNPQKMVFEKQKPVSIEMMVD